MFKKQLSGAGSAFGYPAPQQAPGVDIGRQLGSLVAAGFQLLKRAVVWYGDTMARWATGGRFPE